MKKFELFVQVTGIFALLVQFTILNLNESFYRIFGHKKNKMVKERIFLNGPFLLLILMYVLKFSKCSQYIMYILMGLYIGFEIVGIIYFKGQSKEKYDRARIYVNNFTKYTEVISSSIYEEKKWLSFTYVEFGKEYVARISKNMIERIEYYNN